MRRWIQVAHTSTPMLRGIAARQLGVDLVMSSPSVPLGSARPAFIPLVDPSG